MPSADFCLITNRVTPISAIGFHLIRSCRAMVPACQGLVDQWPHWLSTDRSLSRSPQIRTCTFPAPQEHFVTSFGRTAASFTVAVKSRGFDVLYPKHFVGQALPSRLQPTPHMMFLFISSQFRLKRLLLVRPASFRPPLTGWPLPFASSYRLLTTRCSTVIFLQRTFTSSVHAHAGRTQGACSRTLKRDVVLLESLCMLI